MAYIILRIVLFLAFFALAYYLFSKVGRKSTKVSVGLSWFVAMCVVYFSMLSPIENVIKPFKTIEEALEYQAQGQLLCVLEGESSVLGITQRGGVTKEQELCFFPKGNKNTYGVREAKDAVRVKRGGKDEFVYTIYQYKGTEDYYVIVAGVVSDCNDVVFSDSQNTTFQKIYVDTTGETTDYVCYGTVWNGYPDVDKITISFPSENKQQVI